MAEGEIITNKRSDPYRLEPGRYLEISPLIRTSSVRVYNGSYGHVNVSVRIDDEGNVWVSIGPRSRSKEADDVSV